MSINQASQTELAKELVQLTLVPTQTPLTQSEIMQRIVQCGDCD